MKYYYSILGVEANATLEEIKNAYRKRAKIVHPDKYNRATHPNEWEQANRMLQEINDAYDYLKKNHLNASSEEKTISPDQEDESYYEEPTKEQKFPNKGITTCYVKNLSLKQIKFINGLSKKDVILKIKDNNLFFNYTGLMISIWTYFMIIPQLNLSSMGGFFGGVFLLSIICGFIARFALAILRSHLSKIKPSIIITPIYYIRVKNNYISFAYVWEVDSFYYNVLSGWSKLDITIGDYLEQFRLPVTFGFKWFRKFRNNMDEIEKNRETLEDPMAWLTVNDILRDIKPDTIKKYNSALISYIGSVLFFVISSILFLNLFPNLDSLYHETGKLKNFSSNKGQKSDSKNDHISNFADTPKSHLSTSSSDTAKKLNFPPKPIPYSGWEYYYSNAKGIAPLKITVPEKGIHYFIKVVSENTKRNIKAVFIRSGDTVKIKVPLGTYKIKYANGKIWYGRDHLFGPRTNVFLAEGDFEFKLDGSHVLGHTVELIKQVNGNLGTRQISIDEF